VTSAFGDCFEAELSEDARAILAYARRWGAPFTRTEITDIAPGAAWDPFSRWPKTVAKLDPIRELVRAGFVVEYDEQPVKSDERGRKTYKRWALASDHTPGTLANLLDELMFLVPDPRNWEEPMPPGMRTVGAVRDEILRRFGPRS